MHTQLCDELGIEFPIFAFSHCRDVVAAVSKAGGLGVLGAVAFPAEQLERELAWIDDNVGDHPYGVDIVIPGKYEGVGEQDPEKLHEMLKSMVPQEHRDFAKKLLADHGVPELPEDEQSESGELLGWTSATAAPQIEVALSHDKVKLIANALGTPPDDVIAQVKGSGRMIGALCGSAKQARKHKDAGLDFVIAQGTEGGGHTGEIGSVVLWPEVVDAVAPIPVLAAGGIGSGRQIAAAMAMGAQGVWTGSLWLTVAEADSPQAKTQQLLDAGSGDTVRSRSWTGKPARMLRSEWTEAWEKEGNPSPLGMPLQYMVTSEAVSRTTRYAEEAKSVLFNPVGQIVGRLNQVRSCKDVIATLVEEYVEAADRLAKLS